MAGIYIYIYAVIVIPLSGEHIYVPKVEHTLQFKPVMSGSCANKTGTGFLVITAPPCALYLVAVALQSVLVQPQKLPIQTR